MMLATVLTLCLLVIALLHAHWAFGGLWPRATELDLARTVVGAAGITKMPPRPASLVVAIILSVVSVWPMAATGLVATVLPEALFRLAGLAFALVFVARGLATYAPPWRRHFPEQPFARLDQLYYGPLCLALGCGFLFLLR